VTISISIWILKSCTDLRKEDKWYDIISLHLKLKCNCLTISSDTPLSTFTSDILVIAQNTLSPVGIPIESI
jgi:hypothetical protein